MRVLYGVTGEGLGHAMRSRVVADHLASRGHEVKLVASGRACTYLRRHFDDVQPIPGFSLAYIRGQVGRLRTLVRLGRSARPSLRDSIALYRRAISSFQPDVCISDFDSFSHMFGLLFDRPVISLDHQHVIDRFEHGPTIRRRLPRDFAVTRAVVRAKMPRCHHYVVTSFYFPPPRARDRDTTTLVGPILRPEILALTPAAGDHVLVYQTAVPTPELLVALRAIPEQRFIIYGRGEASTHGNVTICAFDEQRFLEHLATARAVICNGGYTLLSEALFLGKPVLSMPIRHQGEQELNAAYLAELGLGRAMHRIDVDAIRTFIHGAAPSASIASGNQAAFAALDQLLETS